MEWYYIVWNLLAALTGSIGVWLWCIEDHILAHEFRKSITLTVMVFVIFGYAIPFMLMFAAVYAPFSAADWLAKKWRGK